MIFKIDWDYEPPDVTVISDYSGNKYTWEMNITKEQYNNWKRKKWGLKKAFPHLTKEEREFLDSGMIPGEYRHYILESHLYEEGTFW